MRLLKSLWRLSEKIAIFIGNIISAVFLFIFYYTIFALFAIPFRLFGKTFKVQSKHSTWVNKKREFSGLEDFKQEY